MLKTCSDVNKIINSKFFGGPGGGGGGGIPAEFMISVFLYQSLCMHACIHRAPRVNLILWHNEIRDLAANLLTKVCHDVCV